MDWKKELNKILKNGCTDSNIEDFIEKHPEINENVWDYVFEYNAPVCCKGCKYIQYSGMHPCQNCSRRNTLKDYYVSKENQDFKEEFMMIKNAKFTSVWDGGYEVTTNCKVNMETKEVFDIELAEVNESLDILEKEYVVIDDVEYPVFQLSDITEEDNEFWYE